MSKLKLEDRVSALESEIAVLKLKAVAPAVKGSWIDKISGAFANDPIYDEAMRLGREYRESLRPTAQAKKVAKRKNGHTRHGSDNTPRKSK